MLSQWRQEVDSAPGEQVDCRGREVGRERLLGPVLMAKPRQIMIDQPPFVKASGRTGKEETRLLRRGSSKVYSDLKVLMVHFENLVHEQNAWPTAITVDTVQEMWRVAIEPWMNGEHKNWFRYSWNSSLRAIRRRKRMPTWVEIEAVKKQRVDGMDMPMVEADHGMDFEEPAGVEADQ